MTEKIESLSTQALGLPAPWWVERVDIQAARKRVDFEVCCSVTRLNCPNCGAEGQALHASSRRSWRHLDALEFEAWMHAAVPRVSCRACGKTRQVPVPWAREGSGFTLAFEALASSIFHDLPVRQAAQMLRARDRQVGRRMLAEVEPQQSLEWLAGIAGTSVPMGHGEAADRTADCTPALASSAAIEPAFHVHPPTLARAIGSILKKAVGAARDLGSRRHAGKQKIVL